MYKNTYWLHSVITHQTWQLALCCLISLSKSIIGLRVVTHLQHAEQVYKYITWMWWMYPCTLGSHSQDRAKSIWHDRVPGRNGCEHPMSFVQTYDAVILMIVRNEKKNAK